MKFFISKVLTLSLLPGIAAPGQAGSKAAAPDEQQFRHIKTELWPRAYREQDTELLGRLLVDSFQMIDGHGNRSNKKKEMDWINNNA